MALESRRLDLRYESAFTEIIPDAYESLLLEVMRGERSLFISNEELEAAWDVFTPLLHEIDKAAAAGTVEEVNVREACLENAPASLEKKNRTRKRGANKETGGNHER